MNSSVCFPTAHRCHSLALQPLAFLHNWNVIYRSERTVHSAYHSLSFLPSARGLRNCGQATRNIRDGKLNATMASRHMSQPSTSSTTPPPSTSSSGKSAILRRKLTITGSQSRQYSQDKSFDSVRSYSTTDGTITSTSPCLEAGLSRASTAAQQEANVIRLKATIPAIDENLTFLTSSKQKIRLTESEETLLAALFCRVQDSRSADSILRDPYAEPTLDRCEVDFSRSTFSVGQSPGNAVWAAHRARTLDDWCVNFVNSCDGPVTVVHLGCGLDGRYLRVRDRFSRGLEDVHVSFLFHYETHPLQHPLTLSPRFDRKRRV